MYAIRSYYVDRKRKIPVTALLRAFGMTSDEEIIQKFVDIDKGDVNYIETTISKDITKTQRNNFV